MAAIPPYLRRILQAAHDNSGDNLPHSFKHTSFLEPSRAQAATHSSQTPGPSTNAYTQSWRRRSDEKPIPDEPPIQSEFNRLRPVSIFF